MDRSRNASSVLIFSHEQVEKGGLSPSVPAHKSQFPIRVYGKGNIAKQFLVVSLIIKCQMIYLYLRHSFHPSISIFSKQKGCKNIPASLT